VVPWVPTVITLAQPRCQQRANRETAAQRFGGGKHVRRHAVVHIGIQLAGTADAGLTSSKISSALCDRTVHAGRAGSPHPPARRRLPCIGSTITAQVLSLISAFADSRSL
jgi:hypothetical protein